MHLEHWIIIGITFLLATAAAGHALLYKRDPRAALGWIAVCFIFPIAGSVLYFLFGINRVQTRAKKLERRFPFWINIDEQSTPQEKGSARLAIRFPEVLAQIARISDAVTRHPLVGGNQVSLFHNGEQAYPAMLDEIDRAKRSVFLVSYIFETNHTGREFIASLARATLRGVDVRVIIDGVGELYSFPWAGTLLKRRGVRVARFLPPKLIPPDLHINLRNHRKILIADGRIGFTGGMNIGDRHLAENLEKPSRVVDMHFRLTGPVVTQLEQAFLEDWAFATGEQTSQVLAKNPEIGDAVCRAIVDGPNEPIDKLDTILVGVVTMARQRIMIMTPYFLPSRELIAAMQVAALRGVLVEVILPSKNNLPFVHWATRNMLWELLQKGVRVYYQLPPFVHTKLLIVDDYYAQIGSANVDPRSLRLNFELVVEVYHEPFARDLAAHFHKVRERSVEASLSELDRRSLPIRIRDAFCWLFSPYL